MNDRNIRRIRKKQLEKDNAKQPLTFQRVPPEHWPEQHFDPNRLAVWRSQKYLVQIFQEESGVKRLTVSHTFLDINGWWVDGITWDDLQEIKRQVGFGDFYAIEVYPRDKDLVNVANMRHLWIMPEPLPIGWFK